MTNAKIQEKLDELSKLANELDDEAKRRYGPNGCLLFESVTSEWGPVKRICLKAILSNPSKRRKLIIDCIIATQAREGITTTRKQAAAAYGKVIAELNATNPGFKRVLGSHRSTDKPPMCEECDEEMVRYEGALDTGKDGWQCLTCGWSQDD